MSLNVAALKSIAKKRAAVAEQPRDNWGRWVRDKIYANRENIATKTIAAGAMVAGGALAGPAGAAAGQLLGGLAARQGIAMGKAMMSGDDQAVHQQLMSMAQDLQGAAQKAQQALQGVDKDELEDVMSRDVLGWAVGHAAAYGLDALLPGAGVVPGAGAAVAALAVPQVHKLKQVAKARHDQRRRGSPAPA